MIGRRDRVVDVENGRDCPADRLTPLDVHAAIDAFRHDLDRAAILRHHLDANQPEAQIEEHGLDHLADPRCRAAVAHQPRFVKVARRNSRIARCHGCGHVRFRKLRIRIVDHRFGSRSRRRFSSKGRRNQGSRRRKAQIGKERVPIRNPPHRMNPLEVRYNVEDDGTLSSIPLPMQARAHTHANANANRAMRAPETAKR